MNHDGSRRTRPWSLRRMLFASVALHLVLLVLFLLLPTDPPAAKAAEDLEVRFDLTEPPDSELFQASDPVEERPTEEPVDPAPSALGQDVPVFPEPAPTVPPVPDPVPETVEPPEPEAEPSEVEPREAPEDPAEADAAELAEEVEDRGAQLPGALPDVREGERQGAPERLDISRAIRDYATSPPAVVRTPETEPPGTPKGMELPDIERLPTTGFGMDRNLMFESSDYDWSEYTRQIYMAIWRAWHNRLYQTTPAFDRWAFERRSSLLEHQVLIQFTIQRTGEVSDIFVVTPAGCVPLDESGADAMAEVILPRLPDDFPRDRERVRARFIATGDVRNMKRTLSYMKQAGWF